MNILHEVRERTKTDLKEKLDKYGRCAVPRCTGFGKTWLLSEISQDYKTVLYLYPAKIIRQTAVDAIEYMSEEESIAKTKDEIDKELGYELDYKNIRFMTYTKLALMSKDEIKELPQYDLVIMDEMHRVGACMTKKSSLWLMFYQQQAKFIGATATPERMDAFDVIAEFFNGVCVYPYTLHNAVQDGIIKMPYYIYCTYDIETSFKQAARLAGQDIDNPAVKEVLNSRLMEVSNIHNMPNIVRKTVEQYVTDKYYMKYIAFFSSIKQLNQCIDGVAGWFKDAYPDYAVNVLIVSSEDSNTQKNIERLNFEHQAHVIDIIACVDMLNLGYHVSDLTGIIMYRCTQSSTIYIQQLGRALSTGSDNDCVVFDVVDNLHRKSLFYLNPSHKARRKHKQLTKKERVEKLMSEIELTDEEYDLMQRYIEDNLETDDITAFNALWRKVNEIEKEDIYAVDHLATYRELIAKTEAEVKHERVKRATEEYFRIQCTKCNQPIPTTISEVKKMKDSPPELAVFLNWQRVKEEDVLDYIDPDKTGKVDIKRITDGIEKALAY